MERANEEMMQNPKIANSITELIGRTPLLRLNRVIGDECKATILAKLESMEPLGSVKDRLALSLIEEAHKRGDITPGKTTLVEGTSGNTGIALAMIGAAQGYSVVLVMPDSMSLERRVLILATGAKLVLTPATKGIAGVFNKTDEILEELGEDGYYLNQFRNPDNPKVHRETTGPELWYQTDGKIDVLVGGVGTGGTVTGTTQFLKSMKPTLKTIAVEPAESPVLSGGQGGPHKIMGIGAGLIPGNYDSSLVDQVVTVTSDEALAMARKILRDEGLCVGISAGAAVHAAITVGSNPEFENKIICVIIPSNGERYLTTALFEDYFTQAKTMEVEDI